MSSPRVFVLDGHCDAATAAVQSLGRAGAQLTVGSRDIGSIACRSRYAETVLEQPLTLPPKLARWIDDIARRGRFDLIVPATEASLLAVRALGEESPTRAACVVPGDEAIDRALDKARAGEVAAQVGMRVPGTRVVMRPDVEQPAWGYPTVLKPIRSKFEDAGRLVTGTALIAHDPGRRAAYLRRWLPSTPVVEQEYVRGRGLGVSFLSDRGRMLWHFSHERLHELPLTGGASTYRRAVDPPGEALGACRRLASVLRWRGVAMVEFKWCAEEDTLTFLEINPRLWGSLALAISAGVDFPAGLLALASGATPPECPPYRRGLYARNIAQDTQWLRARASAALARPSMGAATELWAELGALSRVARRREVWDHFARDDPGTAARLLWQASRNALRGSRGEIVDGRRV